MSCNQQFSMVTQQYLCRYHEILDKMIMGMTSAELANSISHNFIVQMIPHHRAAIEMSRNLLKYTTCIPLEKIALGIIDEQTKSINDMENILCRCDKTVNSRQSLCMYYTYFRKITNTMFNEMKNAETTNNINTNFIREMIPHHEGAIRMSENALRYSICPELVPILNAIITSQKKGVEEMRRLLSCVADDNECHSCSL